MDDFVDKTLIAATDKRILVIVSIIISSLLILLGCLIFFHTVHAFLRFISYIIWFLSILPFCCWRRGFRRKAVLFPDHVIICNGDKKLCYDNSELKVITIGMHTAIYFPNGRRFVIMFTPITRKMVSGWNNPLIFWGYNGDIRIRNVEKILAVSYIFLFLFHFATGTGVSNFLIWYLFITVSLRFLYWLINYLFLD